MIKTETMNKVCEAIEHEYQNSLVTYGMKFESNKDAYNAMLSELDEAKHELNSLNEAKRSLYNIAHLEDSDEDRKMAITKARTSALFAAIELVQVAAILQKWNLSNG